MSDQERAGPDGSDPFALALAAAHLIEQMPEHARSSLLAFLHLTSEAPEKLVVDLAVTGRGQVMLSAVWNDQAAGASAA